MAPFDGPIDYHRYPPRDDRKTGERKPAGPPPRPSAPSRSKASSRPVEGSAPEPPRNTTPHTSSTRSSAERPTSSRSAPRHSAAPRPARARSEETDTAAPASPAAWPRHAAHPPDDQYPEDNHESSRPSRRTPRRSASRIVQGHDTGEPRSQEQHPSGDGHHHYVRLDPADLPERHTPPGQRRGKAGRRGRGEAEGPPGWKRVRRFALVLALIGLVELTAAALTAQDFRVQAIEVTGLSITPPAAVEPLAAELVGQNWIRANTGATIDAVRALPAVRSAQVERPLAWPPQLRLHVEERQPFARVGAGNNWWVVDEAGMPFRRAGKKDERLYAVTGKALSPQPGKALPKKAWEPVVTFARALSQNNESSTDDGDAAERATAESGAAEGSTPERTEKWALRRIYFDEDGFASLRLEGGAHDELLVRLGAGRWPEKLRRAQQALEWFEKTGSRASELNLVSYNMPVWTPRIASADASSDENSTTEQATVGSDEGAEGNEATASGDADGSNSESESSGREG